jgi:hypothetical protein
MKICEFCSSQFESSNSKKKYCSHKCYSQAKQNRYLDKHGKYRKAVIITCLRCGIKVEKYCKQKYCSKKCFYDDRRRLWSIPESLANGDRKIDKNIGYIRVYCPSHPRANTWGYVYEHRLIMERKLNRILNKDEHVHHKNGIRWDNREDNLEVMSPSEHSKRLNHYVSTGDVDVSLFVAKRILPRVIDKICPKCGNKFLPKRKEQIFCCFKCTNKNSNRPNKVELEKMLWQEPTTHIAKKYGVCDQAVKKWAKRYGITEYPPRGYWQKLKRKVSRSG